MTVRVRCSLFIRFLNLPLGNCLPGWSLFLRFRNLPPVDCQQGLQPDLTCSEPTSRALSTLGAPCFYGFQTYMYLQKTVGLGYRMFIRLRTYFKGIVRVDCSLFIGFLNLTPGNCVPWRRLFIRFPNLHPGEWWQEVQPDFTCSEPTFRWPSAGVHTVFTVYDLTSGTVGHGYSLFIQFQAYLQVDVFNRSGGTHCLYEAQAGSLSISRTKLNRANIKRER